MFTIYLFIFVSLKWAMGLFEITPHFTIFNKIINLKIKLLWKRLLKDKVL